MNSYGRKTQIKALRHMFSQDDMQTVLINGKRRVGKAISEVMTCPPNANP